MITKDTYITAVMSGANTLLSKIHSFLRVRCLVQELADRSSEAWACLSCHEQKSIESLKTSLIERQESFNPMGDILVINMETGNTRFDNSYDSLALAENEAVAFHITEENIYDLETFVDDSDYGIQEVNIFEIVNEMFEYGVKRYEDIEIG